MDSTPALNTRSQKNQRKVLEPAVSEITLPGDRVEWESTRLESSQEEEISNLDSDEGTETYNGPFVQDAYHGYGQYIAKNVFGESWTYEGMFYVNNFHGYGTLSYADGSIFSGLYKMGKQFGPGVLTYPDGKEDVGHWVGSQLMRLCISIPGVEELCTNYKDRMQASVFKKLVQIPNERNKKDIAKEIFESITSDEELLAQADKLYSHHCKNPQSIFFNKKLYKDYSNSRFTDLKNVLDILLDVNSNNTDSSYYANVDNIRLNKIKEKQVQDEGEIEDGDTFEEDSMDESVEDEAPVILSWNNQDIIIELMLHSFKYRRQECITNYDIGDILCHRRLFFAQSGEKEQGCIQMLQASYENDPKTILKLITTLHLNPNVMDKKGNSMILLAAANNSEKVIQVLGELEVNINSVNDEGFNALNHTLVRYLALMYNVTDWAIGFMPSNKYIAQEMIPMEWMISTGTSNLSSKITSLRYRGRTSGRSVRSFSKKKGGLKLLESHKKYIFDLSPMPPNADTIKNSEKKPSIYKKSFIDESDQQSDLNQRKPFIFGPKTEKMNKLKKIESTFILLLETGVNVNGSVTPAPVLTLAIFTQNVSIIELVLQYKADPNSRLEIEPGNLTPLHVTVLLKPGKTSASVVELLLEYGADPHLRTDGNYRQEYWEFLLSFGREESFSSSSVGMTPLHALVLRPDADYVPKKEYLLDICCLLAWHTGQDLFHGLTPLALAIAVNSVNFMSVLLVCSEVNINEKFDDFWGNYLTTFMIIHGVSSDPICQEMLKLLLKCGADPLYKIFFEDENIMNFIHKYRNKIWSKKHKLGAASSQINANEFDRKENILRKLAKKRVEDHIKGVLIRSLLYCMQMTIEEDPQIAEILPKILRRLREWVGYTEFSQILSMILQEPEFSDDMQLVNALIAFINFTELFQTERLQPDHIKAFLEKMKTEKSSSEDSSEEVPHFISKIASDIKHIVTSSKVNKVMPAAIDRDGDLYRVCYECMKRSKNLQLCPDCELVYFCSIECKIKSYADSQSKHKCSKVLKTSPLKHGIRHSLKKRTIVPSGLSEKEKLTTILLKDKEISQVSISRRKSDKPVKEIDEVQEKTDLHDRRESKESHKIQKSVKPSKYKKLHQAKSKRLQKEIRKKEKKKINVITRKLNKNIKRFKLNLGRHKEHKEELYLKLGKNVKRFSNRLIDLKGISSEHIKTTKLLKKVKTVGWRHSLFSIIDLVRWDSSTSTSDLTEHSLRKLKFLKSAELDDWSYTGTICPPVLYSVLGGKTRIDGLCEQHDTMYKFPLKDRHKAYFFGIYEALGLLLEKSSPFIVFIPQHGTVLYKYYPENFENYSFN